MPVVVSMLNSYSGWAAAAAGFMLKNDLLIITGALVEVAVILSYIMCKAMNRSLAHVIFGGFGTEGEAVSNSEIEGAITETSPEEVAGELKVAKEVMIVPGYGMAVAQAQHVVKEITEALRVKDECPVCDSSGGGSFTPTHECSARRGKCALRYCF